MKKEKEGIKAVSLKITNYSLFLPNIITIVVDSKIYQARFRNRQLKSLESSRKNEAIIASTGDKNNKNVY